MSHFFCIYRNRFIALALLILCFCGYSISAKGNSIEISASQYSFQHIWFLNRDQGESLFHFPYGVVWAKASYAYSPIEYLSLVASTEYGIYLQNYATEPSYNVLIVSGRVRGILPLSKVRLYAELGGGVAFASMEDKSGYYPAIDSSIGCLLDFTKYSTLLVAFDVDIIFQIHSNSLKSSVNYICTPYIGMGFRF